MAHLTSIDPVKNSADRLAGELYYAFTPELLDRRTAAAKACARFNASQGKVSRREEVEILREIIPSLPELPPAAPTAEEDENLLSTYPIVLPPFVADYGTEVRLGDRCFINFNCIILDTCLTTIGARTLFAPNVSLYSASHPLDPELRDGTNGPENGKPISIGEDCWLGGNVTVCPGVTIGDGCTIGAASVVTKNIPPYCVAAGNPARVIRKIDCPAARRYYGDAAFDTKKVNGNS